METNDPPLITLLRVKEIFAPEPLEARDILIADERIAALGNDLRVADGIPVEVTDIAGGRAVPGFIDQHVHVTGGGGEGGYGNRTPEITAAQISAAGITSVVGLLGTDSVSRSLANLLAKIRGLSDEGISAYMYTGAYRVPPPTLTGDVQRDLWMIPEIIGTGEVAISDHRSSQPTQAEIERLVADTRVGAMLAGKKGICHFHLGSGARGLEPLRRLLRETEIPADQVIPTHINRRSGLLEEAAEFAREFGASVDITAYEFPGKQAVTAVEAVHYLIQQGVSPDQITMSSDCQGSMPVFDEAGHLVEMRIASNKALAADWKAVAEAGTLSFENALALVTRNVARVLGLSGTKGRMAVGADADITVLDEALTPIAVFGRGRRLL